MDGDVVLCERDGPVALVTLNRPDKHNAVNRDMQAALAATIEALEADDDCLVIVLTGAGDKAFCAGADMGEVLERGALEPRPAGAPPPPPAPNGVGAVARAKKPVIGAINGYAYGLGAQLSLSVDIRIASENARWRFVGASYGLVVSGADLPRIVGPAVAKELLFTTRVVDADEALRIGLANRVVPAADLLPTSLEMARQIAANSPGAVRWAKRVVDAATTIEAGRAAEAEAGRALRGTSDNTTRFRAAAERVIGGGA
ncbi:MAG TPA: enoyl-CoA hydratase/isomerase family protein [Dehalococcoidia bacterium]|nr:enoyl-CoA hydratase/isomerase family protein [Dehalococcoidia bacterium]